jgi:acetyl esterase
MKKTQMATRRRGNRNSLVSAPDGNTIRFHFIRPDNSEIVPCVYYIHGGGMAVLSAELGVFKAWGRIIAAQGVAVAMIDFRNCVTASSVPEVAPYPAGLNDCVSGLKWVHNTLLRSGSTRRGSSSRVRAAVAT